MRFTFAVLAAVMVFTVLGGCSSKGTTAETPTVDCSKTPDDPTCKVKVDDKTGAVKGVVTDAAVKPLANVHITMTVAGKTLKADTAAAGTFAFSNLPPGQYFVQAAKPGYSSGQTSVEVVAGVDPKVTKIQLLADPSSKPAVEVYHFTGYIECSLRFVVNALAACSAPNDNCVGTTCSPTVTNDLFAVEYPVSGNVTYAYSEMVWEATNQLGESLKVEYTDDTGGGLDNFAVAQGASPQILRVDAKTLGGKVATDNPLLIRVFTGDYQGTGLSATLEQKFDIYTVIFYGFAPGPDYVFSRDGEPKLPV